MLVLWQAQVSHKARYFSSTYFQQACTLTNKVTKVSAVKLHHIAQNPKDSGQAISHIKTQ
jgi:hypothetical protein